MPSLLEIGPVVLVSSIYYHYFIIISLWKRTESFSYRLESPSRKGALCHVKLKLAQWFWRRFFKFYQYIFIFSLLSPFWNRNVAFIWINLNPLHPRMLCAILGWKDQCLYDLAKNQKNQNVVYCLVWMCSSQCFNSYMKKIPILKIEYLSSYTLFFSERGYCVYIEIKIEIKPARTFRALKNMSAVMLHFVMHICEYRMTWSIDPLDIKL